MTFGKNITMTLLDQLWVMLVDGGSRIRHLIFGYYKSRDGTRLQVKWDGWFLSAIIDSNDDAHGLHDQDYIHRDNKLKNPLDSHTRILHFGVGVGGWGMLLSIHWVCIQQICIG